MPEGDAVRLTARRLDAALTGQVLTVSDLRVPQHALADLRGRTVTGTVSRGKHLLTRIGDVTLHTHLGMDGRWRTGAPHRMRAPGHQIRVVLGTDRVQALGLLLRVVELLPRSGEQEALAYLGPDLLGADWDADEAVRRLRRAPERSLFEALRDQRDLAGIGTIYAAEGCFVSGLHPLTQVGDVPDLRALLERTRRMMDAGWSRSGRMWVYGQRSCRRCDGPVTRLQIGPPGRERPLYVCPRCQAAR